MTPCTHQSGRSREGRIFCIKCGAEYRTEIVSHWVAPEPVEFLYRQKGRRAA
jgi:hypothetical protein